MFIFKLILISILFTVFSACTRIETGEVGLRREFSGTVRLEELSVGFHQTVLGDVIKFSIKEILIPIDDLRPQTLDKTTMKEMDLNFLYTVNPGAVGELFIKYGSPAHMRDNETGDLYPMANYVTPFVRASLYTAVSRYNALDVNDNRQKIEEEVIETVRKKLTTEGLGDQISISQINIRNIQIADALIESANNVVKAQNDLKTKMTEIQIAKAEASRIEALIKFSDERYIRLLQAQASMKQADSLFEMAKRAPSYIVVPQNFSGMLNIK